MCTALKRYDILVDAEARDGKELLDLLKKSYRWDIVLLDLEMPGMNGSETLDILKRFYPYVKVIMLTQYTEEELIKDFFNRGVRGYVTKHEDMDVIAKAIRVVHASGYYRDNLPALLAPGNTGAKKHLYKLRFTKREKEIIHLLCEGKMVKEIAQTLCIAEKTIENHLTIIYGKSKVSTRQEFMILAINEGFNYFGDSLSA